MNWPFKKGVEYREFNRLSITVCVQIQSQSFVIKTCINEWYFECHRRRYFGAWYAWKKVRSNLYLQCIETEKYDLTLLMNFFLNAKKTDGYAILTHISSGIFLQGNNCTPVVHLINENKIFWWCQDSVRFGKILKNVEIACILTYASYSNNTVFKILNVAANFKTF